MTASTDMSTPVTRGELRAEIEQLELRINQRFEQVDQRFEQVDQRFEQVDQRFERLEQRLDHFATKADLETWGGALLEHLRTEFGRHVRAIQETMSAQISVVDEKYKDLPGRVNRLETTVFGPERPRIGTGPKRRRRAGRRPA